jgi:isocitrate/isopropylmalate dehydrogenase
MGPPSLGIVTPITDQSATLDAKNMKIIYESSHGSSNEIVCQDKVKPGAPQWRPGSTFMSD